MLRIGGGGNLSSSMHRNGDIESSVVVAMKNEQAHAESALLSILDQRDVDHEVIVVDDGSTDDTLAIVRRLADQHERLRIHRNPSKGKCAAFNFGVSKATGRFVCIFAGDDIMPPGSLAARVAMIREMPDDRPVVGLCKLVTMSEMKRFDGHLVPRARGRGALSGVSPLMNRLALWKIFPVPESLPNEDTWMELAVLYFPGWSIVHSDVIGCAWRVHSGNSINMTVSFDEYNRRITARMRALRLFYDKYAPELSEQGRRELMAKIDCESQRVAGSMLGVLFSKVGFVDRLRALSITNAIMYGIRRRLYGLLSGW